MKNFIMIGPSDVNNTKTKSTMDGIMTHTQDTVVVAATIIVINIPTLPMDDNTVHRRRRGMADIVILQATRMY
jgi:hypothetical protein